MLVFTLAGYSQQASPERVLTFKFVPGEDMFYVPWKGNDGELNNLFALAEEYREPITAGDMPIYVNSYSASMRLNERNRELAFIRANRVKSELITHKGLKENHFVTKNYTTSFTSSSGIVYKDIVVVTLHIPIKKEESALLPEPTPQPEPQPEAKVLIEPEQEPTPVTEEKVTWKDRYRFAIRTNVLYDALLLPSLGLEWRINKNWGIKVDGSYSYWGSKTGKIQKMWMVSPEVRQYMGAQRRFYLGVGGNIGSANLYKYAMGNILNKLYTQNTGYQGDFWNAGITLGYQLYLNRSFSVDFNLGLGYTRFEYDALNLSDGVRLMKDRDLVKNFWGPTQAGVSLLWKFGK